MRYTHNLWLLTAGLQIVIATISGVDKKLGGNDGRGFWLLDVFYLLAKIERK